MDFYSPIREIPYIGPQREKIMNRLGVKTIEDFLYYFPSRYDDFSKISSIKDLKLNETSCICGKIIKIENIFTRKRGFSLTEAAISDETGTVVAFWYNQPYLKNTLKEGGFFCFAGKLVLTKKGSYFNNPVYEKIENLKVKPFSDRLIHTARIVPVYPETRGISSRWLRFVIKIILERIRFIPEVLPPEIIKKNNLLSLNQSLRIIHFPDSFASQKEAVKRFSFQELFFLQLFILSQRIKRMRARSFSLPINLSRIQNFVKSLSFELTKCQKKAVWQILKDMERSRPMFRLLQGDVGSGKTIVAAIAALNVVKSGGQVAFMAPTEILAKQHFETIHNFLKNSDVNIGLLTSKTDRLFSKKLKNQAIEISKKKLIEQTAKGEIDILIGTHSLIQKKVKFKNLFLAVVDEQHRFGIDQRSAVYQENSQNKKPLPHFLSMTATPIPRTLALTLYGDLDISILDEMPKGKRNVSTIIFSSRERNKAYELARKEMLGGRQVFVICPRIEKEDDEEGEEIQSLKTVKEEYQKLSKKIFKNFKVGILHGKMGSKEKEKAMKDFKNKKTNILVSTSVIEVGIDIPDVTVMIVEGAERFGLAQLHQFRGRIGRSGDKSYFLLFCQTRSKNAWQRLMTLTKTDDGLKLAEADLKIRGPGDFVGKKQWGRVGFLTRALANISLIGKTREAAREILEKDRDLKNYSLLKKGLTRFKEIALLE